MGLFDLPAPIYGWLDAQLGPLLPPFVRVLLWGAFGAVLSMELYRLISPQKRLHRLRAELAELRRRLSETDGDAGEALPLARRLLTRSLRQVVIVTPPAILASLPVLTLIAWISLVHGSAWPAPGQTPEVDAIPQGYSATWTGPENGSGEPHLVVRDPEGRAVLDVALAAPVEVVHKRRWWNLLFGNPAGYLPDGQPVEAVTVDLPARDLVGIGPDWLRGWEPVFFIALLVVSISLKFTRRIA